MGSKGRKRRAVWPQTGQTAPGSTGRHPSVGLCPTPWRALTRPKVKVTKSCRGRSDGMARKDRMLKVRVTEGDMEALRALASGRSMSVSAYVLDRALAPGLPVTRAGLMGVRGQVSKLSARAKGAVSGLAAGTLTEDEARAMVSDASRAARRALAELAGA